MKKILIIEDQAAMRKNLAFILELEGFKVHVAGNGREGLALAESEKPDLILCDVMMPEMDGHELIRTLRQNPACAMTPFVFLTARSDRGDVRNGMNFGADDYLTKPVVHEELMATVRARLQRQEAINDVLKEKAASGANFKRLDVLRDRFGLTPREAEVLAWLAQGKTNADIGVLLEMSERTVKHHVSQCFLKMDCENRSTATLMTVEALTAAL